MLAVIPLELKERGAKRTIPTANAALIVANVLMFWLGWTGPWTGPWTVGPGSGALSIVTHAFSHFSLWHLVGNMWVLFIFGNPVNRRVGNTLYLLGYMGTVVALGLFAKLFLNSEMAGASGAIFAVITMSLLLMPAAILEIGYLAVFPITLLVGLVPKPKHWLDWFIRWGSFSLRVVWCLALIPLMQLWSFYWHNWSLTYLVHLLGMLCGVAVVLLLPTRISMRRAVVISV